MVLSAKKGAGLNWKVMHAGEKEMGELDGERQGEQLWVMGIPVGSWQNPKQRFGRRVNGTSSRRNEPGA